MNFFKRLVFIFVFSLFITMKVECGIFSKIAKFAVLAAVAYMIKGQINCANELNEGYRSAAKLFESF
jgi:hypothetical protein